MSNSTALIKIYQYSERQKNFRNEISFLGSLLLWILSTTSLKGFIFTFTKETSIIMLAYLGITVLCCIVFGVSRYWVFIHWNKAQFYLVKKLVSFTEEEYGIYLPKSSQNKLLSNGIMTTVEIGLHQQGRFDIDEKSQKIVLKTVPNAQEFPSVASRSDMI